MGELELRVKKLRAKIKEDIRRGFEKQSEYVKTVVEEQSGRMKTMIEECSSINEQSVWNSSRSLDYRNSDDAG